LAVVAAVDGRLCRPVARNPQLAVVAAYRAREFAVARHVELGGTRGVDVGDDRSVARNGNRDRGPFQRQLAGHLAVGAGRYLAQGGRRGNDDRNRNVLRIVGVDAEFQRPAVALEHQVVDHIVVGRHADGSGRGADRDVEERRGRNARVVARLAPVLRHHAPAAFQPRVLVAAAVDGGTFDVGADFALRVVEAADLLGGEHSGEFVHVVAFDLRRGGDVRELGFESLPLSGLVRSRIRGIDGLVERLAVGFVERFELLALARGKPQFAHDLLAGGLVQLFDRLVGDGGRFGGVDGGARFGNGAVDFAVGGADDPAGLGHGTVDLAVGGVYGAARFGQGPGDLPVGRVAGRVDDSPGFGQKLFQFVTGGRGLACEGEEERAKKSEELFHSAWNFKVAGCRVCRRSSPPQPVAGFRSGLWRASARCTAAGPRRGG